MTRSFDAPAPRPEIARFCHAQRGMTRFPPNVESLTVERAGGWVWLVARRNDAEMRFPLAPEDVEHLVTLLKGEAITPPSAD